MKGRFETKKIVIHILVWVTVFVINLIIIKGYSINVPFSESLVTWIFYIILFYANYLLFMPYLLFRKKAVLYGLVAVGALTACFLSVKLYTLHEKRAGLVELSERLSRYEDVKESYEQKRSERHRRERERIPPEERGKRRPSPRFGPSEASDLTPREELYEQYMREYERARYNLGREVGSGFNPLTQHNMTYVSTMLLFFMASIVTGFIDRTAREEKIRRETEQEKTETELAYLKQQINPHFLFNTLNSIYSYTIGVSQPASDAVLKLSSILRYMLYETTRDKVNLSEELAVVDDYIELQKLRVTDKTVIEMKVEGNTAGKRIEPMLLIPIIENAFKFGVDSVEPSFVAIRAVVEGDRFRFDVSNRVVRRTEKDDRNSGIGIRNIRRRLELIYGKENYRFTAGEKDDVFTVSLDLLLNDEKNEMPGSR